MTLRSFVAFAFMAATLGACSDLGLPDPGFATAYFFSDDDADSAPTDACDYQVGSACSPAPQYCVARGYHEGTARYQRCLISVNEELRKKQH